MPKQADIALIMEGSYPYVLGGVSAWMHEMIQAFPQYQFVIIFLGSVPEDYPKGMQYKLPENVVHFEKHFLFTDTEETNIMGKSGAENPLQAVNFFHDFFPDQDWQKIIESYPDLDFAFNFRTKQNFEQFFASKKSWDFTVATYQKYCTAPSFISYFWTLLSLQKPLWRLINIMPSSLKVKAVHTISTGYAGLLGALLHFHLKIPLLLTEHGIYTKERRIELLQSHIFTDMDPMQSGYLRGLWIRFFELLSRICYVGADPILSLYSGARHQQIEEGAEARKLQSIANGVNINKYKIAREQREQTTPMVVALIGRIVPIKGTKNFIRAISTATRQIPDIQAWIVGSADENPEYLHECQDLTKVFNLENNVTFMVGQHDPVKLFPKIGLLVLSSISEGMPLILLEGFAAWIPAVTTNVGACPDLIIGVDKEDQALGKSGTVVNIADPQALANAIVELLTDTKKWKTAQQAAISRVGNYYDQKQMFNKYAKIYQGILGY